MTETNDETFRQGPWLRFMHKWRLPPFQGADFTSLLSWFSSKYDLWREYIPKVFIVFYSGGQSSLTAIIYFYLYLFDFCRRRRRSGTLGLQCKICITFRISQANPTTSCCSENDKFI